MIDHNDFKKQLKAEIKELESMQRKLEKNLSKAPSGKLHVLQKKGRNPQYYLYQGRKQRHYLPKSKQKEAARLAQKEYDMALLELVNKRLISAYQMLEDYYVPISSIADEMIGAKRKLVTAIQQSDEEYVREWYESHPGCMNPFPIDSNSYSDRGEQMRSKSEKFIADIFQKYQIPYVYEPELVLKNGTTIYPDFLVLNVGLRKTYIYEHFGMMSDSAYVSKNCKKLFQYELEGYLPGKNLLLSMEASDESLDNRAVEKMIKEFLLD